jgi:hypothetical protein
LLTQQICRASFDHAGLPSAAGFWEMFTGVTSELVNPLKLRS